MDSLTTGDEHRGRRQPFKLNTSGCCFICLSDVGLEGNEAMTTGEESSVSLSVLLRYLQINLTFELYALLEQSLLVSLQQAIKLMEKADFLVEVCKRCKKSLKKISELVQLLEVTTMEVHHCLQNVGDWIMECNGATNKTEEFQRRMETDISTLFYLKPIENFRRKFANKCAQVVSTSEPRVRLKKINTEAFTNVILTPENYVDPYEDLIAQEQPLSSKSHETKPDIIEDAVTMASKVAVPSTTHQEVDSDTSSFLDGLNDSDSSSEHSKSTPEKRIKVKKRTKISDKTCDVCNKTFSCRSKLIRHKNIVHLRQGTVICDICGNKLTSKFTLQKHYEQVHSTFPCKHLGCDKRFGKDSLRKHEKFCEKKPGRRKCENCNRIFSDTNNQYATHVVKCNNQRERTETCSVCNKKFANKKSLRQHKPVHEKSKRYECNYCDKPFSSRRTLNCHIQSTHFEVKFDCQFPGCQHKYTRKTNLNAHVTKDHPNWAPVKLEPSDDFQMMTPLNNLDEETNTTKSREPCT